MYLQRYRSVGVRYTDGSRIVTACDMRKDRILASWTDAPPPPKTQVLFYCLECGREFPTRNGEQVCEECADAERFCIVCDAAFRPLLGDERLCERCARGAESKLAPFSFSSGHLGTHATVKRVRTASKTFLGDKFPSVMVITLFSVPSVCRYCDGGV